MDLVSTSGEFWLLTDVEAISLWCGAERILRGWVVSPAALQFL